MKNPHRISIKQVAEEAGYDNSTDFILNVGYDSVIPACCDQGCEVEPDGRCEHDCPSVLLAAGMI